MKILGDVIELIVGANMQHASTVFILSARTWFQVLLVTNLITGERVHL